MIPFRFYIAILLALLTAVPMSRYPENQKVRKPTVPGVGYSIAKVSSSTTGSTGCCSRQETAAPIRQANLRIRFISINNRLL